MKDPAKILLYDIENAPMLAFVWEMWETNVIEVKEDWYILSIAYKWLGEDKIHCLALPDFPEYRHSKSNDEPLVSKFQEIMNQADYLVAHNGDNFDFKKLQARFLKYNLEPPHPLKNIDTLKAARRVAKFSSNKLDDLGQTLGVGRKLPHTGKHLWFSCMEGDLKAWRLMRQYNKRDVELLEKVYLKLRPFMANHPNLSITTRKQNCCPFCQSERRKFTEKYYYTKTREAPIFQCASCGKYYQGKSEPLAVKVYTK